MKQIDKTSLPKTRKYKGANGNIRTEKYSN